MKKTFIKKGLREIKAHWVQYFLLALVIGLGVAAYSSFNDFSRYRKDGLDQIFSESNFMDLQVTMNYGETMTVENVTSIMNESAISNNVEDWDMRLVFDVFLQVEVDGKMKVIKGQVMGQIISGGEHPGEAITVNKPLFYVDDPDSYSSSDAKECYIERKFSEAYDLGSGNILDVNRGNTSIDLKIVEQVAVPEYFFVMREGDLAPNALSFGVLLLPIDTATELYTDSSTDQRIVNDIVLRIPKDTDIQDVENDIQTAFEARGVAVKFTEKDENPSRFLLVSDYENDKESMQLFPVIIFIVSAFGLVMALRRMIRSHRPQIGIFKALGIPNRAIMVYFSVIGIAIAIAGTVMGYLLSIPFNMAFLRLGKSMLDFPVDNYNVTYIYYIMGGIISIVLCLSCTLIPAMFAVRVKPIDVIQGREGMSKKKIGRLGGVLGHTRFLPVSLKLTVRNLLRKPFRSLSTIIGVGISLALFLGFMMVMQSAMDAFMGTTSEIDWDYEVRLEGFQPYGFVDGIENEYQDVEQTSYSIMLPSNLGSRESDNVALIYASENLEDIFKFEISTGQIREGMIIISEYHSEKLGLEPGEKISIELPILDKDLGYKMDFVQVTIGGIHTNHLGTYAFMSLATMQNLTGLDGMVNVIHLRTNDGMEIRSMENDLITRVGVSTVTHSTENSDLMDQYMNILIGTVVVMAVISSILAGAIVYIMFRISAREQERDYATMKTLGTSLRKIAKLIFQEAVFVTILGIGTGVIGGYGLSYLMLNQPEYEAMNIEIVFNWPAFIAGSILISLIVITVSLFTMRYIAKINIANVIRERVAG